MVFAAKAALASVALASAAAFSAAAFSAAGSTAGLLVRSFGGTTSATGGLVGVGAGRSATAGLAAGNSLVIGGVLAGRGATVVSGVLRGFSTVTLGVGWIAGAAASEAGADGLSKNQSAATTTTAAPAAGSSNLDLALSGAADGSCVAGVSTAPRSSDAVSTSGGALASVGSGAAAMCATNCSTDTAGLGIAGA